MKTIPDSHLDPVLLSAYLDDEVTTGERDLVENHLVTCEACNLELESLSWTVNLLGQLPQATPPRTFYITEAMLEPDISPVQPWWDLRRWLSVPWTPLSAALAAMLFFVIITQSTSFDFQLAAPQAEVALVSEAPPTIVPGIQITTIPVSARSAQSEGQAVEADAEIAAASSESLTLEEVPIQADTALSTSKESAVAEFAPTNPEESADNAEDSNSQAQPLVLVVVVTVLILLLTMAFVWSRRKQERLPHD